MAIEDQLKYWGQQRLIPLDVDDNFRDVAQRLDRTIDLGEVTGTPQSNSRLVVNTVSPLTFKFVNTQTPIYEILPVTSDAQVNFSLTSVYLPSNYKMELYVNGIHFNDTNFNLVQGATTTLVWNRPDIILLAGENELEFKATPL